MTSTSHPQEQVRQQAPIPPTAPPKPFIITKQALRAELKDSPNRKQMMTYINRLEDGLIHLNTRIVNDCVHRSELERVYAAMRVAVMEVYGEEGVKKVVDAVKELTAPEVYESKAEFNELFGEKG